MLGSKRLTGLFRRGETARLRRLAAEPVRHLNDRHNRALAAERQLSAMFGNGDCAAVAAPRAGVVNPLAVAAAVIVLLTVMAGVALGLYALTQGQEISLQLQGYAALAA